MKALEATLSDPDANESSLAALALCVRGMVIARSSNDATFASKIREVSVQAALTIAKVH